MPSDKQKVGAHCSVTKARILYIQLLEALECYNCKHILALEIINKTRETYYLCKFRIFLKEAHKKL